ncbi:MAG: O-antigen ligase family protein [Candidatus Eiseniibacteriota bacterium]
MSAAPPEVRGAVPRSFGAFFGSIPARTPSWVVRGALAVVALEILALVLAGVAGPLAALGVILLPAYAALCWIALPAAWLATLAVVPFSMEIVVPGTSSALWVPTEPMIFVFLAIWALRGLLHGARDIPRSPILGMILLLALIAALSAVGSRFQFLSFKAILSTGWFVAFGFLFPLMHGGEGKFARRTLIVLGAAGLLFSVVGIVFIARHGVMRWTGNAMGRPFFPEHCTYSVFMGFALSGLLALALAARRPLARLLCFVAAAVVTLAILLSLARAAFLALAAVFAVTLWYLLRAGRGRTVLAVVAVTVLAGLSLARFRASSFVGLHAESIANPGELSNLERISRWLAAWNMARAHPLLGVGYGTYEDNYFSYRILTLQTQEQFRRMGVHSEYFRSLGEMGWLGLLAVVAFIVLVFRQGHQAIRGARSPADRSLSIGLVAGFASYVVHSVFNSYGESDKVVLPFWVFTAFISMMWWRSREGAQRS